MAGTILLPETPIQMRRNICAAFDEKMVVLFMSMLRIRMFKYPNNSFYSYIESVIISSSAKTLAQPTLLVQEGEKGCGSLW